MSNAQEMPKLAVVGPGALGTLFTARLAIAGVPVVLLDYRPERAQALQASGLCVCETTGEQRTCVEVTADPTVLATVDAALVLVKAYRTETVAATLAAHLPPKAVAVSLQNGLGNVEVLAAHLGQDRVIGGATAQGALLREAGVVYDTGAGPTAIGYPDGHEDARLRTVCDALLRAGFAVSITDDLPAALWRKVILNAAINPVAALTRLRNGALAEHDPSLRLMTAAAREAHTVARRHGVRLPRQDWRARLDTVCHATAPNVNSMLADVLKGRRTEVDAINGAIVRIAEQYGLTTPVNRTLWCLVQTLEAGYAEQVDE